MNTYRILGSSVKKVQPGKDSIYYLYNDSNANFGLVIVLFGVLLISQNK